MVKHTKGFKGLSKKVLSAILAASMIMTSSSFVMAAEPTEEPVPVESTANDVETTEVESEVETEEETEVETEEETEVATFSAPEAANEATGRKVTDDQISDNYKVAFKDDAAKGRYTYTGEAIKPEVNVWDNTENAFADPSEYEIKYFNNDNVVDPDAPDDEQPYVEVSFTGTQESVRLYFEITALNIEDATVKWGNVDSWEYDGTAHHPEVVSANVGDVELSADDYDVVVYRNSKEDEGINAGTLTARLKVKEDNKNLTGETKAEKTFTISRADLGEADVTVNVDPIAYNSSALSATDVENAVTVTDNVTEKEVTNFKIQIQDKAGKWVDLNNANVKKDIGTYPIRIVSTGGNFEVDTYTETSYEVVAEESLASALKGVTVSGFSAKGTAVYNGKNRFPQDLEKALQSSLTYDLDYEITNDENEEWVDAGEYTLNVAGLNKYAGQTATVTVKITPKQLEEGMIKATQGTHPNSGDPADVVVTVTDNNIKVDGESKELVEGIDYTYTTDMNEDEEGGDVIVTGLGNYTTVVGKESTVTKEIVYNPTQLSLEDPSISVTVKGDFTYDGDAITLKQSDFEVVETDGSKTYTLDSNDFGFVYDTNVINKAGEVEVEIQGKGDYSGTRTVVVNVAGESFENTFDVEGLEDISVTDEKTVQAVKQGIKVTYKSTGGTYAKSNYTVEFYDLDGNKMSNADKFDEGGTYTVVIKPNDGIYVGSIEYALNVIGEDLADVDAEISAIDSQVYSGAAIEPEVVVTVGTETLKEGVDYFVTYSNNVNAGSADVLVTGINKYSGTIDTTFDITKGQQTIEMTNPLQVRDLGNGTRTTTSKNCTLKLGFGLEDKVNLSYSSDNEDVATVANGVITYQGVGECTITVTAKETDNCLEYSLPIKVKVGSVGTPTFTPSVTSKTAKKAITVTSSTVRGADGFEVQYSVRSDWWRASTVDFDGTTNGKLYRQTIKTYHSNKKYYIRVRAYQVVDGVKQYSDWSPAKTATTK